MLNIVLFGPPGAGKGTQAARLIEKYGFHHISTGEVIREEIRQGSPLGLSVKGFIDKGQLAPDALVIDLIADYVSKHKESKGNIFDGFPRTTPQAEAFDKIMEQHGTPVNLMLAIGYPLALPVAASFDEADAAACGYALVAPIAVGGTLTLSVATSEGGTRDVPLTLPAAGRGLHILAAAAVPARSVPAAA